MGFQVFMKQVSVAAEVTVGGRLFQIRAAAALKAPSPTVKSGPRDDQLLTGRRAETLAEVCVSNVCCAQDLQARKYSSLGHD